MEPLRKLCSRETTSRSSRVILGLPLLGAFVNGVFGKRLGKEAVRADGARRRRRSASSPRCVTFLALDHASTRAATPSTARRSTSHVGSRGPRGSGCTRPAASGAGSVPIDVEVQRRRAERRDDARRHRRRLPHPPLRDRVHGEGQGLPPLLRVPEPLHLLDARPHPGRQPAGPLRRLGGRRPLQLPAHRLLVSTKRRTRRPARRRSSPTASATSACSARCSCSCTTRGALDWAGIEADATALVDPPVDAMRVHLWPIGGGQLRGLRSRSSSRRTPLTISAATAVRPRALPRLRRQERADPALRLAPRRDGRPHAGHRAHPRGHDGHGGRLPRLPPVVRLRALARRRWRSSPSSGAATALFAATIALVQNDIKKVLAYSTVSQLGFMFLGVGVGAFTAGFFHVFTHAFFKACLFLGAGSVIHAMHARIHDDDAVAGHAQHGRPAQVHAAHVLDVRCASCLAIAGVPLTQRLLLEGRDPLPRVRRPHRSTRSRSGSTHRRIDVVAAARRGSGRCSTGVGVARRDDDGVLHVPRALPDVLRRLPRLDDRPPVASSRRHEPRRRRRRRRRAPPRGGPLDARLPAARVAVADDDAAHRPRRRARSSRASSTSSFGTSSTSRRSSTGSSRSSRTRAHRARAIALADGIARAHVRVEHDCSTGVAAAVRARFARRRACARRTGSYVRGRRAGPPRHRARSARAGALRARRSTSGASTSSTTRPSSPRVDALADTVRVVRQVRSSTASSRGSRRSSSPRSGTVLRVVPERRRPRLRGDDGRRPRGARLVLRRAARRRRPSPSRQRRLRRHAPAPGPRLRATAGTRTPTSEPQAEGLRHERRRSRSTLDEGETKTREARGEERLRPHRSKELVTDASPDALEGDAARSERRRHDRPAPRADSARRAAAWTTPLVVLASSSRVDRDARIDSHHEHRASRRSRSVRRPQLVGSRRRDRGARALALRRPRRAGRRRGARRRAVPHATAGAFALPLAVIAGARRALRRAHVAERRRGDDARRRRRPSRARSSSWLIGAAARRRDRDPLHAAAGAARSSEASRS